MSVAKAIIYKNHGNAQDGITTLKANEIYDIICATEAPVNLDFSNGLKYWAPKADRTGSASGQMRLVTDSDGVTALTTLKTETDVNTQYNGIATVKFRADVAAGDRLYLLITWKNTSTSTYEAYPTLYQWDAEGNKTQASYTSLTANSSTAGKWNTRCVSLMDVVSDDSTFSLQVQETRTDGSTDPTIFFKRLQIVKPTASVTYVDLMTGNEIYADGQQAGGTATDGAAATYYNGDIRHFGNPYIENLYNTYIFGAVQGFNNGDFSNGLKYWSIREYNPSKAPQYTALSQQATVTAEGALKFNPVTCSDEWLEENPDNTNIYAGASSVPFMLPGVMAGDTVYLAFDARNCASQMRVRLYDNSAYASSGSSSYAQKFAINADSDWRSYISTALTVSSDSSVFFIELQKSDNNHTAENFLYSEIFVDKSFFR